MNFIHLAENGLLPDKLIRLGIRRLLAQRLKGLPEDYRSAEKAFAQNLATSPLAVETDLANSQHYEVPADFFLRVLGPKLKYSCCLFDTPETTLADAEQAMLRLTCERAEIEDGSEILELGCGWGSLTCWMAEQFPNSQITAVTNSASQKAFIEKRADKNGLRNVRIIKADVRNFTTNQKFDRVVSIEMFEHMRNYQMLFRRIADWLFPDGKVFIHIFCHRHTPYLFETEGTSNWMGRHFFSGGTMPSENLFRQFEEDLTISNQWQVDGMHYWRTCEEWLKNLDLQRTQILATFRQDLDDREAKRQLQRWRMFFMACTELFRYRQGHEWYVAHYLLQKKSHPAALNSSNDNDHNVVNELISK